MQMSEYIDNAHLSTAVKDMYSYIDSHNVQITHIMDLVEDDLRMMFPNVKRTNDTIILKCESDIDSVKNMVSGSIDKYTADVLSDCKDNIKGNIFKIYKNGNEIQVKRRI